MRRVSLVLLATAMGCAASAAQPAPDTSSQPGAVPRHIAHVQVPTPAVNKVDGLGRTALHYAARLGHDDIVAALLAAGADVGARDAAGFTPLMRAVQGGDANAPVVERLLAAGADPGDPGPEADAITLATTLGAERLRLILESAAN